MRRIEQVNELLRKELGTIVAREVPLEDGLITITYVKCTLDLKNARVGISVIPDNNQLSALKRLRRCNSLFTEYLHKRTRLSHIPHFTWEIDKDIENFNEIDVLLNGSR